MSANNRNHGPRVFAWRAWCARCQVCLAMNGHHSLWPDEIICPTCGKWCKVLARASTLLKGDVICPPGSGRNRVEEK